MVILFYCNRTLFYCDVLGESRVGAVNGVGRIKTNSLTNRSILHLYRVNEIEQTESLLVNVFSYNISPLDRAVFISDFTQIGVGPCYKSPRNRIGQKE